MAVVPGSRITGTAQGKSGYRRGRLPMGAFATPICRENSLSPVLRGSFLGVLETGDEARRSLHMVLQRGR